MLALGLLFLYLLRILFRFGSNYLTHKAAWHLVGDLRGRLYNKLQSLDLGFFHDKQTGDLMSRVINDTRDFELLYAHMIPDILTNVATFVGVLVILLRPHPPDHVLRCYLLQDRPPLLQGLPEEHG